VTATLTAPTQALSSITASNPDAFQFDAVPDELKAMRRWVTWYRSAKGKVPIRRINKPAEWLSFDEAVAKIGTVDRGKKADGIGFVIGDGFVGIDLDHILDGNGALKPEHRELFEDAIALGSYMERSPGGDGFHVWIYGNINKNRKLKSLEIYDSKRFFTITGLHHRKTPRKVASGTEVQQKLDAFYAKHFPSPAQPAHTRATGETECPTAARLTGDEILAKLFAEKKEGAKWLRVWHGHWSADYSSQSEADFAIICKLRFYAQGDLALVEDLIRSSDLERDKWDEMRGSQTYLQQEIARADAQGGKTYSPELDSTMAGRRAKREAEGFIVVPFWWLTHTKRMGELALRTLLVVKSYADMDGTNARMSQATIAAHLGLRNEGEVSGTLRRLEVEHGLLEPVLIDGITYYHLVVERPHVDVGRFSKRFGEQRASGRGSKSIGKHKRPHVDVIPAPTSTSPIPVPYTSPVTNTKRKAARAAKTEEGAVEV
jgi:hypothetical protein